MSTTAIRAIGRRWARGLAITSLSLSALEVILVGVAVVVVVTTRRHSNEMIALAGGAWVFAGLGSIGFVVAAVIGDFREKWSALSLAVAIVVWLVCGTQMLV